MVKKNTQLVVLLNNKVMVKKNTELVVLLNNINGQKEYTIGRVIE